MEKFIYSQHDKLANFYNPCQVSDLDPEAFSTNVKRSILLCKDPSKLKTISDHELCFLGTFDDETAKFTIEKEPKVILDVSKIVESCLAKYESVDKN